MILTYSNQKGGVGKSTLATLYANHLATEDESKGIEGKPVVFIEADLQQSITAQRKTDIENWGQDSIRYDVKFISPKTFEESEEIMRGLRQLIERYPEMTIIIDVPGNITDDYLAPIFVYSDYIICPYSYQDIVLHSTSTFIRVIERLRQIYSTMKAELVFIPNRVDKRIGLEGEKRKFMQCDALFETKGLVTPKVYNRADLTRFTTVFNTPKQEAETEKCFAFLDNLLNLNK